MILSTVWLQDFEGDVSDWTLEQGWELTESESVTVQRTAFTLMMTTMMLLQV